MIRVKYETEDLLLSSIKNCETFIEQTHTRLEETLEFKMIKPKETFHFNPAIQIKGDWMLELTSLEVYNSIYNMTGKKPNPKFIIFLMKQLVVFYTKKSEIRLKETWIFRLLQLPI